MSNKAKWQQAATQLMQRQTGATPNVNPNTANANPHVQSHGGVDTTDAFTQIINKLNEHTDQIKLITNTVVKQEETIQSIQATTDDSMRDQLVQYIEQFDARLKDMEEQINGTIEQFQQFMANFNASNQQQSVLAPKSESFGTLKAKPVETNEPQHNPATVHNQTTLA